MPKMKKVRKTLKVAIFHLSLELQGFLTAVDYTIDENLSLENKSFKDGLLHAIGSLAKLAEIEDKRFIVLDSEDYEANLQRAVDFGRQHPATSDVFKVDIHLNEN